MLTSVIKSFFKFLIFVNFLLSYKVVWFNSTIRIRLNICAFAVHTPIGKCTQKADSNLLFDVNNTNTQVIVAYNIFSP